MSTDSADTEPSTIAEVDSDSGRLIERRALAYLVIWGAHNERRAVVLEQARAEEMAANYHGQIVCLGAI